MALLQSRQRKARDFFYTETCKIEEGGGDCEHWGSNYAERVQYRHRAVPSYPTTLAVSYSKRAV